MTGSRRKSDGETLQEFAEHPVELGKLVNPQAAEMSVIFSRVLINAYWAWMRSSGCNGSECSPSPAGTGGTGSRC